MVFDWLPLKEELEKLLKKGSKPSPGQQPNNRLLREKSPCLLQHAFNPVNWYPWGEEAFTKAKKEKKPVFLSIGYSTCHWCHVIARESFVNEEVARLLNENYIAIKLLQPILFVFVNCW